MLLNLRLSYQEGALEVGESVSVLGRGVREPDPEAGAGGGYRDGPPTRVRMSNHEKARLNISDVV